MNECPGCGGPLAGDEETCPACGLSIGAPMPVEEPEPVPAPEPVPEEPAEEAVPSVSPQADDEEQGKRCPACGTLNPEEAQFCVQCRHAFNGGRTIFGMSWVIIPALLAVFIIVAVAAAFSTGLIGGAKDTIHSPTNTSAISGAETLASQIVNQSRNTSSRNSTGNNTTATYVTTLNVTPTRTVDPNATPWNAQEGAGIYHTEGGTHNVGPSDELRALQRAAAATPTPLTVYGVGDGSGHATGPLSWVGTGNWSPGYIDLPAVDAQVVLMSQGTTAFVLVDATGSRAGFGVFLPPGGKYTVPIPAAGRYVIAFGTANRTDSWSASILLPGSSGGQAVAPPVSAPATQLLTFAGTGGGTPGSFNLSAGTVHVRLLADQMTMAYLKDPWGATLSTTVAGPNEGGTTVAITQTGMYRLDIWGTGTWTATVIWTGAAAGPTYTVPTVATLVPTANVTTANATAAPVTIVTAAPTTVSPF